MNAGTPCTRFWQVAPHFLAGKAEDWSQQPRQRLHDPPDRSLSSAPRYRVRGEGVEPVFDDIEIKRTHLDHAEVVDALINFVKRKLVIPAGNIRAQIGSLPQNVLIDRMQLFKRLRVAYRIKVVQISQRIPK